MNPASRPILLTVLLLTFATNLAADWEVVEPGIEYQRYRVRGTDVHVARVDMTREDLRVVSTRESDRGLRVSQFARRNHALVAINAGYFDEHMKPVAMSVGPCGSWAGRKDTTWGALVAFGDGRAEMFEEKETMDVPDPWINSAVSGWPMLVNNCKARTASKIPGSKSFTHSPHPRSAVGFSRDGSRLYFVVVEGRSESGSGMTLPDLASWMREQLSVCMAVNLDGGGSSALWVGDRIVNKPVGGKERRVADHLAIVRSADFVACEVKEEESQTKPSTTPGSSQPPAPSRKRR